MKVPSPYLIEAEKIGQLIIEKQAAYGDSFSKSGAVMRILYPNGIKPENMDDALTIVRCLDKFFRIATKKDAFGENPWKDIMGYSLLSVVRESVKAVKGPAVSRGSGRRTRSRKS